jgi:hypothetical protein
MRWSLGFGPFRIYGGRSAASRRAAARRRSTAYAQARAERREQQERAARLRVYNSPEAVAQRAAQKADHDARTHRAVVSACSIDPVADGDFTLTAPGRPDMRLAVPPDLAMRFLPLRRKDVIQVTMTADGRGIEEFWHMARGNGAEPRNGADFSKRDTEQLGPESWLQIIPAPWPG